MHVLCSHNQLYIHIYMPKHLQHNKNERRPSLEKYTSRFIWKGLKGLLKVLLCERWVGDRTELQHIDPHSYGHNSVSFPFSWAAQPRAWGPSLSRTWSSFQHLLSKWLTSCLHPGYIIVLRPLNSTCRQSRLSPWYLRPDAPVIYTGAFTILTDRPGSICNTCSHP